MEYIILPIFFSIAVVGFGLALHFSKYKQEDRGCCGGGHCSTDGSHKTHGCYSSKVDYINKIPK